MLQRQKKPPSKAAGHTQARQEMPEQDGEALQQAHARKIERIFPDPKTGLTSQQAAELLQHGYGNEADDPNVKTTRQIIRENTLTFFNLVFVVLAALLAIVGSFADMTFLLIAGANSLIGIIQQIRSRDTLAKLSLLAEAKVKVVRDGRLGTVPVHKLVREDIVELAAGTRSPPTGRWCPARCRSTRPCSPARRMPLPSRPGTSCSPAAL